MECGNCGSYRHNTSGCTDFKDEQPSAAAAGSLPRPEVAGRRIEGSIIVLELRAKLYIGKELEKLEPDNALIAILSDTVRLGREFSDTMNRRQ